TGDPLGPVSLYPAVALSGLVRYEGALFPAEFRGNLFSAQHNSRSVGRHVLVPEGSTFRSKDEPFLTTDDPDFHPSDVLEDADGTLRGTAPGWWSAPHPPPGSPRRGGGAGGMGRGGGAGTRPPADPWGLKEDWAGAAPDRLCRLLADPRPAVRDRVRRTLAARGKAAVAHLAAALEKASDTATRQQLLWALAGAADASALPPLRRALDAPDPDTAITAARALGARSDRGAAAALARLLAAEALPVRFAAAEALARCGDTASLPAVWSALIRDKELDRFL